MGNLWIQMMKMGLSRLFEKLKGHNRRNKSRSKESLLKKLTESPEAEYYEWSQGSWEGNGPDADCC